MAKIHLIRALHSPNYRLFFSGQTLSLTGTWMTHVATSWLVYRLTHSPFLLGAVSFANQISTFFLAPFAGVLIDRWNLKRMNIITQCLSMLQSALLAFLSLTHLITIEHILALSIFQGLINAFDMPGRQAFMAQIVEDPEDLGNAIALNSLSFNSARLVGPALAGILVAWKGEGICFLVDTGSYLAVIAALAMMRVQARPQKHSNPNLLQGFREGWDYAFGFTPIRTLLLLIALLSLMGLPYMVLMPVFAGEILTGGPHTLGFLTSGVGLGAILGALYLASRKSILGLGKIIASSSLVLGISLAAFAFSTRFTFSMALVFLVGFAMMVSLASSNTLLQTITENDKRGRIMSLYIMAFSGAMPVGSLGAGILASHIGAPRTLGVGAIACVLGALLFAKQLSDFKSKIRPVYIKKGIIPADLPPVL